MSKILSILAVWLCGMVAFAQLGNGNDWELPGNPGVETSEITVSVNDAVMGSAVVTTVTAYGVGIYPVGSTVSLVATPATGYHFVNWIVDGSSVSDKATCNYVIPDRNVAVTATFAPNKYNVIFDANNGTENTVFNLDFGSSVTAPADPEKTGYSFNGWTPAVDGAVVPANDITFTANWKVNAYKATFVVDELPTELSFDFGAKIVAPANPAKEGYVFNGWSPAVAETMLAENVTYTATWKLAKYNVTFVSDGKTISTSELEYGSVVTAPANPVKEGYNFLGWNPEVDATVPAHDVTYTASFGKGAFLVTFMVDGKVFATASEDFGEPVVLPETNPEKEGHTFAGWKDYVEGATVPAENITYEALWTVNSYAVVFVSGEDTVKSETAGFGSAITLPETPVKEGYTFVGWTPAVAATVPAQDVTYSATWKINRYNVTFEVDGKVYATSSLEYGSAIVVPATTPVKEGYTFSEWGNFMEGATVPAEDVTYRAEWTANKYVVTFISDGDTIQSDTLEYIAAIKAPADPVKTGYVFTGWTPEVDDVVPSNNVTYTATWVICKYTVTFVTDGDTIKSESLEYGAAVTAPENPVKSGYDFAGWSPEVAETMPAEDVTYTATWTIPVGISTLTASEAPEATYYTVSGVKVAKPTKAGIYIVNGVKVIVR